MMAPSQVTRLSWTLRSQTLCSPPRSLCRQTLRSSPRSPPPSLSSHSSSKAQVERLEVNRKGWSIVQIRGRRVRLWWRGVRMVKCRGCCWRLDGQQLLDTHHRCIGL